ncbi:putative reverse transcriptase zinc-binding domain-containing protein [Helianthus annuus]|nr:putative reverse transcriptase zinc-binding domain-containing protein [Helianthus annuus]
MIGGIPLRSFFRGVPGKGDCIAFWLDPWVSCDPLKDMFPILFQLEVNRKVKISERIMIGSDCSRFIWQWKRLLESAPELAELSQLSSLLENFYVSGSADKWAWIGNGTEDFSVGAVKKVLVKGYGTVSRSNFSWCKWLPVKCNVFAWRADLGSIPTVDALRKRNIFITDSVCGLCNDGEDTVSYLFTECYVANMIWNAISRWCKVPQIYAFSFQDLLKAHEFCALKDPVNSIFYGVIIIACWCIWKARNDNRFSNRRCRIEKILSDVKSYGFLWARHRSKCKNLSWENWRKFVIM